MEIDHFPALNHQKKNRASSVGGYPSPDEETVLPPQVTLILQRLD